MPNTKFVALAATYKQLQTEINKRRSLWEYSIRARITNTLEQIAKEGKELGFEIGKYNLGTGLVDVLKKDNVGVGTDIAGGKNLQTISINWGTDGEIKDETKEYKEQSDEDGKLPPKQIIKEYIKIEGCLCFSQTLNGRICVWQSYPHYSGTSEDAGDSIVPQEENKIIKFYEPDVLTESAIVEHFMGFMEEMIKWEADNRFIHKDPHQRLSMK